MIAAGKLDKRVTILARVVTKDPTYGTDVVTWEPAATVWAEVQDVLPSRAERVTAEIAIAERPARMRMRWRDDVTQANRVGIGGRTMKIVAGPAMIGRRQWLEIMIEEISTEGQQP
jgi:SPP1 family predicted phage head-tail adaptor